MYGLSGAPPGCAARGARAVPQSAHRITVVSEEWSSLVWSGHSIGNDNGSGRGNGSGNGHGNGNGSASGTATGTGSSTGMARKGKHER